MDTGRKIMNLRLDRNLTQRDLASACGISPGALSKIETGANNPSAAVLRRLAGALGTAADYLLDDTAPYPPPRSAHPSTTAGGDPNAVVSARITREERWLLEALRELGAYWREAALAIPSARVETIRLVRFLLQRDQMDGAREAEDEARRAAGRRAASKRSPARSRTRTK